MKKLTKQAIKRLIDSPKKVKMYNGCFNVVIATAKYSGNKSYELRVEVTHPYLYWQCGNKQEVKLVAWEGCAGTPIDIPEELNDLIVEMELLGTLTDEQAAEISARNAILFSEGVEELGFC